MPDSNFMGLQLRDLHLLQVMLSEGSLTRAASLLNTTQPTLSKALARLRSEVGMVFQSFNLFAHKTVLQNVSLAQIKVKRRHH